MDDDSLVRLGQLFPRLDVLASPVRLQLSELLASGASVPAVLALEIAGLPLPTSEEVRGALRLIIEKGLGRETLAALRTLRLSDIVPSIRRCDGTVAPGCPVRLQQLLRRQGDPTWAELGRRTLGDMATWPNMGPLTLAGLVGAAVGAALATTSAPTGAADSHPPEPLVEYESAALVLLLHHEQSSGSDRLRRAFEGHAQGDGPAEVRVAASRLLAAADNAVDPRLALLDRIWQASGDHRDRGVFAHRCLQLDRRTSTKELAQALGLSEARVGQLQVRAEQRARDAAGAALDDLATELRDRLGAVCRLTAVDDALAALGLPAWDDPRSALLVWLAGPYLLVPGRTGWLAIDPPGVLADTRRSLHEDGGVRRSDHLAGDLEAAGVAAPDVGDWLAAQEVVVDGLVITLSGSPADVAERLLSATGRAMTAAELAATGTAPHGASALDSRLRRDPRFVRVGPDHFELAEWGSKPFTESPPPGPDELFPAMGRAAASTGRSQLRVEVDAAALRGTSDPVPLAVVEALGVPCGGRRTFTTRFGPVALSRTAAQASRGSVRPVALAAGASVGDALLLDFDAATGDASVELVLASCSAAS